MTHRLQVIVSNFAEAASRICWRCKSAERPSRRIPSLKASQCTVRERKISTVVRTMSNTNSRQIENQIRPQGRENAAKRLAGGMVVHVG